MNKTQNDTPEVTLPFLKWVGGKRWFGERWRHLMPTEFDRYIEPFLGSGAVFFALQPKLAILSDLNQDLINCYCAIRDAPALIGNMLSVYHANHDGDHYYTVRANKPDEAVTRAAWFLYLNRTCWNGLYRVNRKNEFNVPIGTKKAVILETDNFKQTSKILQGAQLISQDFEHTWRRLARVILFLSILHILSNTILMDLLNITTRYFLGSIKCAYAMQCLKLPRAARQFWSLMLITYPSVNSMLA